MLWRTNNLSVVNLHKAKSFLENRINGKIKWVQKCQNLRIKIKFYNEYDNEKGFINDFFIWNINFL